MSDDPELADVRAMIRRCEASRRQAVADTQDTTNIDDSLRELHKREAELLAGKDTQP